MSVLYQFQSCIKNMGKQHNTNESFNYLEQRLDLGVQPPPLPVAELEVGGAVALQDADCIQLLHPLLVVPAKITINTRFNV